MLVVDGMRDCWFGMLEGLWIRGRGKSKGKGMAMGKWFLIASAKGFWEFALVFSYFGIACELEGLACILSLHWH